MHILITGAAGMIGRKIAENLVATGSLGGRPVTKITLQDIVEPHTYGSEDTAIFPVVGDMTDHALIEHVMAERPDVIFHLAAVVSGEAEADLDKGYRINLDGTRALLEAVRRANYAPRVVFASSIAVYGPPFADPIPDDVELRPLTSYGAAKAMGELLVSDYSRREILDGISLRLPTICVRPGKPNRAASGFFSSIIREPLKGEETVLPVGEDVRHFFASPRSAVNFFLHAATMDTDALKGHRALAMPGVSASVGEEIAALREIGGDKAVALIRKEPDPTIAGFVHNWPANIAARRARDHGFEAESDFAGIVRAHVEDEHGGKPPILA
ncbi:D-erythronate dehydrogenase [Afifella aestuarii]|uniref:D-erythronate dehydrogenase n=1 Tax=Afifella aestuarii TaxID=1909496 RepID=UPI000FE31F74|nr:D-erythronate dehydrogenase [Afifella aestuarii]